MSFLGWLSPDFTLPVIVVNCTTTRHERFYAILYSFMFSAFTLQFIIRSSYESLLTLATYIFLGLAFDTPSIPFSTPLLSLVHWTCTNQLDLLFLISSVTLALSLAMLIISWSFPSSIWHCPTQESPFAQHICLRVSSLVSHTSWPTLSAGDKILPRSGLGGKTIRMKLSFHFGINTEAAKRDRKLLKCGVSEIVLFDKQQPSHHKTENWYR